MTYGIVIPHYNNGKQICNVLDELESYHLECVIVDDGSKQEEFQLLKECTQRHWIHLLCHQYNQGKGAAVATGLLYGEQLNWTHALQIDADGQHDIKSITTFIQKSINSPNALILANPIYGNDIPFGRLIGRSISKIWVWIETFSLAIKDPLCGFRIYPLQLTCEILRNERLGKRMDFDPEIAIHLAWAKAPIINIKSRVIYPINGTSHFRIFQDNILISFMFTRISIKKIKQTLSHLFKL